jgi:hypothetical protein
MSLQPISHINEILDRIFVHLDISTLVRIVQLVNKQWYIVADEHVDYTWDDNLPIRWFSYKGRIDMVNKLLCNPKVDPSAFGNGAIREASSEGHLDVVNRLLKDSRVDPSACNNEAIQ